ncbi:MAG TPA: cytochrome c biogenesis protein CcdA [Symbiobacteriaceae bacterium]|nr:cytochrome c biogenesis protein CcdA [Symbiobacteriaceae bacterium]
MGRPQGCPHHEAVAPRRRLRTWISLTVLAAAVLWVIYSFVAVPTSPTSARAEVGQPAPDFTGTTLDRQQVRLSDYAGKPLVINFFASWCDPCKEEAPVVRAMQDQTAAQGYALLGVATQDDRAEALQFMAADGLTFPAILDDGKVARAYGIVGPPTTFFIDADGIIRHLYMGPLTRAIVAEGVDKATAGADAPAGAGNSAVPGLALAVGLGLLSFLSPCVLPLLPAYMGYISGLSAEELALGKDRRRIALRVLAFALGLILVFTALGASASLLGGQLTAYRAVLARVSGLLVLAFGLHMLGMLQIALLQREFRPGLRQGRGQGTAGGPLGALAMGAAFGLGWTPCVGPALGTILLLATQEETALQAVGLLLAYGLGMTIPFVVAGLAWHRVLGTVSHLRRHLGLIEQLGGAVLVLMGLLLVVDRLGIIANWFNRLL